MVSPFTSIKPMESEALNTHSVHDSVSCDEINQSQCLILLMDHKRPPGVVNGIGKRWNVLILPSPIPSSFWLHLRLQFLMSTPTTTSSSQFKTNPFRKKLLVRWTPHFHAKNFNTSFHNEVKLIDECSCHCSGNSRCLVKEGKNIFFVNLQKTVWILRAV